MEDDHAGFTRGGKADAGMKRQTSAFPAPKAVVKAFAQDVLAAPFVPRDGFRRRGRPRA